MTVDIPIDLHDVSAVMDSNVLVELVSYHDLDNAFARSRSKDGAFHYRKQRLRNTLILFEYLHRNKLTTYSMRDEPIAILSRLIPEDRKFTPHTEHLRVAIPFLAENIFRDWTGKVADDGEPQPTGNEADDFLVDVAAHWRIPLITYEGIRTDGRIDPTKRIQKRSKENCVKVMTPSEFWAGKIDFREAATRITRSLRVRQKAYVQTQQRPDLADCAIERMRAIIEYVLAD